MDLAAPDGDPRAHPSRRHRAASRATRPEPSPLSHEILNARPVRVPGRRAARGAAGARGADAAGDRAAAAGGDSARSTRRAIARVVARGLARSARRRRAARRAGDRRRSSPVDGGRGAIRAGAAWLDALARRGRATLRRRRARWPEPLWVAAERLPELIAASRPALDMRPPIAAPRRRGPRVRGRATTALVELLRGRVAVARAVDGGRARRVRSAWRRPTRDAALLALESDGVVLRGAFTPAPAAIEWCDRRLLARIHRADAQPPARRDRAGHAGRLHAVPVRLAARRAGASRRRAGRPARRARAARRLRAGRRRVGAARAAGARAGLRAGRARRALLRRRGRVGRGSRRRPRASRPGRAAAPDPRDAGRALPARARRRLARRSRRRASASPSGDAAFSADAARILDRLRQRGASFVPRARRRRWR